MKALILLLVGLLAMVACSREAEPSGDPVAGERVVQELDTSCGMCHTLESAGFSGAVAPNLDDLAPGYDRVLDALRQGPGAMPSYADTLTADQLRDVAAYVSGEAGS